MLHFDPPPLYAYGKSPRRLGGSPRRPDCFTITYNFHIYRPSQIVEKAACATPMDPTPSVCILCIQFYKEIPIKPTNIKTYLKVLQIFNVTFLTYVYSLATSGYFSSLKRHFVFFYCVLLILIIKSSSLFRSFDIYTAPTRNSAKSTVELVTRFYVLV